MQMTTITLVVNPCDVEEDNLAVLSCFGSDDDIFLMSRFPDEDDVEFSFDEPAYLLGVKATLSPTVLLIEINADDADALNGDTKLEIFHSTDPSDLPEVEETLRNILSGSGNYVSLLGQ